MGLVRDTFSLLNFQALNRHVDFKPNFIFGHIADSGMANGLRIFSTGDRKINRHVVKLPATL